MPNWLTALSTVSLVVSFLSAGVVIADLLAGNVQRLRFMNFIWAVIALYAGPVGLAAYFALGRDTTRQGLEEAVAHGRTGQAGQRPAWHEAIVAANETGAACFLGSLFATAALLIVLFMPLLTPHHFLPWMLDYVLAIACGLGIQYRLYASQNDAPSRTGLGTALRVEPLSVTAWQIGLFGWMVFVVCVFFPEGIVRATPVFWFLFQLGMAVGFVFAYPINLSLVRSGLKTRL